jgi:hypothetical protein
LEGEAMTTLAKVYVALILVFGLTILIDSLRLKSRVARYAGYGVFFALVRLAIGYSVFAIVPEAIGRIKLGEFVIVSVVLFVGATIYASMGLYCSSKFGLPGAPLTRALYGNVSILHGIKGGSYLLAILVVVVGGVGYSFALFTLTSPTMSELLRSLSSNGSPGMEIDWRVRATVAVALVEFAFAEEILFRLGLQNWFAKVLRLGSKSYWVAVVLSSAIWSIAHANTLDPEWVKLAQVFPLGIALGFMFRKFGVECCIFTHALFNLVMMYLGPHLIGS